MYARAAVILPFMLFLVCFSNNLSFLNLFLLNKAQGMELGMGTGDREKTGNETDIPPPVAFC